MKRFAFVSLLFCALTLLCFFPASPVASQTIYFDDTAPDLLILGNSSHYEIALRKTNGAIAYITDKNTGQQLSPGSRYECLWGAVFPHSTPDFVGGCNFQATGANQFGYSWSAATQTLTLSYTPDAAGAQQVAAQVTIIPSDTSALDMQLHLHNNQGSVLDYVLFPADLVFIEANIQEALLPILPGVALEPAFFAQNRTYTALYPGYPGLFADYVALTSSQGQLAIYSLYGQGPIQPVVTGFVHDDAYISDSTFYYHTFAARLGTGSDWHSPVVRLRVGQTPLQSLLAYRTDNGLDQFSPLRDKFGERYDQITQSPLYKVDAVQFNRPFTQYTSLLDRIPAPGILHPVAFQPGGHDQNYPDFLPPASAWGTTAVLADMFRQAQARGLLVMPYTNPTWWDDESPTLQNLPTPLTINDLAVLDDQGRPLYENYGSNGGYVMSPYAPFGQQRLAQLVDEMTASLPSDLLFEDQIGARPLAFDHNPAVPYPTAYPIGWLEHTRTYQNHLLMTELGFDRLAETEAGFHGSILLPQRYGFTADWLGTDTWHPYPLAAMLVRDKVLFYQHDLAPETFTVDKATLAWNMAFGYMLSYDLVPSNLGGGTSSPWLGVVAAFQKHVFALYAGELITDFVRLVPDVTQTSFGQFTAITNWNTAAAYTVNDYILPPQGAMINKKDGTLVAGIFTSYNKVPLSSGDHYLIEERKPGAIVVRQPLGTSTSLTLKLLPGWTAVTPVEAWAFDQNDQYLGKEQVTVTSNEATFTYRQEVSDRPVAYFKLLKPYQKFIPLIFR